MANRTMGSVGVLKIDLIHEAFTHGLPRTTQAACQEPRLLTGSRKWQSTLVTLTVNDAAGDVWGPGDRCHYFNSDLWRYGGRASFLRNPDWHELDSIDLKIRPGRIEVRLNEAQTRRSTTWSWTSGRGSHLRVSPWHFHVVEMVCGYLNLAAGCAMFERVTGLFSLPHGSLRVSSGGLSKHLHMSFVDFSSHDGDMDQDQPTDVVEELTRVCCEPMDMVGVFGKPGKDGCFATAGFETGLTQGIAVKLPWSVCRGNPCICGDSVMVLDTTQEQPEVRELACGEQYLAISYVWTQHDGPSLLSYVRRAVEVTGTRLAWIDRLCINQRCDQHKSRQVPRMRDVYEKGYATVALVPDITETLPTIFHSPTSPVPLDDLSFVEPFIAQMKICAWRTRCWTWQEGLLGGRGYYVTQKQVLPARLISDLLVRLHGDNRPISMGTGLMDSLGVRSLRCQIKTWSQHISIGDLLDADDRHLIEYWLMPQVRSLMGALQLTQERTASRLEDQIYSVLGMVPGGEGLRVVYGESRNAILRRAVNVGLVGAEILDSASVSNRDGESWAAIDDTSKHIGQIYRLALQRRGSVHIDDKGLVSQFHRLEGVTAAYVDGMRCVLKMANGKEEIRCLIDVGGKEELRTLGSRVDQVLLLEEEGPGCFETALFVSGTGLNVVRVATGMVCIEPWMEVETQLVWRVVG